jgi:hypothetical protein
MAVFDPQWLAAFVQVVLIDLTLAGDNAVVMGVRRGGPAGKTAPQSDPYRHPRRHRAPDYSHHIGAALRIAPY